MEKERKNCWGTKKTELEEPRLQYSVVKEAVVKETVKTPYTDGLSSPKHRLRSTKWMVFDVGLTLLLEIRRSVTKAVVTTLRDMQRLCTRSECEEFTPRKVWRG